MAAPVGLASSSSETYPVLDLQSTFSETTKKIVNEYELSRFRSSKIYTDYINFLKLLSESVEGKNTLAPCSSSPAIEAIVDVLTTIKALIKKHPVKPDPHCRYGNPAFKDWYEDIVAYSDDHLLQMLPPALQPAIIELRAYWLGSFGNPKIGYGTGHETNFMAWLFCLDRLGVWDHEQHAAVVSKLFFTYIEIIRTLQETYKLEPAGSQGPNSLDDYHFLPFFFGSSQLCRQEEILPSAILDSKICGVYANQFMFLDMINTINKMKRGPFHEHSPKLYAAAQYSNWESMNKRLLNLYQERVLSQFPIMQHFPIGSIFRYD